MLYFDLGSEKIENENPDSPEPAEEAIDDNLEKEETAADKNEDKNEEKKRGKWRRQVTLKESGITRDAKSVARSVNVAVFCRMFFQIFGMTGDILTRY